MNSDFQIFVETKFIPFLEKHKMVEGTISNGLGDKAKVKMDKHGFYNIQYTTTRGKMV